MQLIKGNHISRPIFSLLIVWTIVQGWLLWQYGIMDGLESEKYINEAIYFSEKGHFSARHYYLYTTQIILIFLVIKSGTGFIVVVVFQLLLNLISTLMFYRLAEVFLQKNKLAILATFIFIINIPYQQYNTFLYTESVFYSLTIIFSSYLLMQKRLNSYNVIWIAILLILLSITRPTGILFFPAALIYILFRFVTRMSPAYKILILSGGLVIFLFLLNGMLQTGGNLDFMLPFKRENIICGVNTTAELNIKTLEDGNSLKGLAYYVFNNSEQFFRLAQLKTIAFFGFTRNYYSPLHNYLLLFFYYPFYLLSLIGIWKKIRLKDYRLIYMVLIIGLFWLTTALTCDDWHNRFVLTVFPFIFLTGIAAFISPKRLKDQYNLPNIKPAVLISNDR